jgi:hypothetical protein
MDLPEYIKKMGVKAFSVKFNVSERAALAWQYRTRRPRPEVAQEIVDNSPVTWEGIYRPSDMTG